MLFTAFTLNECSKYSSDRKTGNITHLSLVLNGDGKSNFVCQHLNLLINFLLACFALVAC